MHTEAWRIYLDRHGLAPGDIAERMHGRRNDEIVAQYFGNELSPEEVFEHGAGKERLFREMMRPYLDEHLVPGVVDFLNSYDSIPCALASNAEPPNIEFVLEGAEIRQYFDVVIDGHQVDRPKPHPDIYLRAAERLGVTAGRCVVFEDSPAGVQAGLAAGAQVVAVLTHPAELPPVDLVISNFLDQALDAWLRTRVSRP